MYAHIDCNNFFASCERLFRPGLEHTPVAVLSNNDGCIISRSAEVKALGIPMGAPVFQFQQQLRTEGVRLFSANFELYGDISERIVSILREITPLIEVYSIDECFLDLSQLNITNLSTWAKNVQKQIQQEVGMPVSIGIGSTKTLAKVATNYAKKHGGIVVIETEELREQVLKGLAVGDVWGIGWRTAPKLRERGMTNAWQLVTASDAWLRQYFNRAGMRMISELRGVSCLQFGDKREKRQSIMVSRAFGHKVREYHQLESATASFATRGAAKLRAQSSVCSKIVVYLTTSKHAEHVRSVSKSVRLAEATADTGRIIAAALGLLEQLYDPDFSYQKAMIVLLDIVDREAWQLSLTDPVHARERQERLMLGVDTLNARYGLGTVWHATEDKSRAKWQSKHALRSQRYTTNWTELPRVKA
jgi:DNA polymerase V